VTLIDTSVWIEHLRRHTTLRSLHRLPQPRVARPAEVLAFIEQHALAGAGIGYVDAHLLAAAALTPPARLWSGDRRLAAAAGRRLGLGVQPDA
jgi:predicted nucleic acid-binding protein